MWILVSITVGIVIGILMPFSLPLAWAKYASLSFLAGFDSVLGAIRAHMEGKYNFTVFSTGFITNALLAALLTYVGDRLGVDLYMAAIITFGVRIFQNLTIIRIDILNSFEKNRAK